MIGWLVVGCTSTAKPQPLRRCSRKTTWSAMPSPVMLTEAMRTESSRVFTSAAERSRTAVSIMAGGGWEGLRPLPPREPPMALARSFAVLAALLLFPALALAQTRAASEYFPDATWQHRTPAQSGIDAAKLKDAIDFAIAAESRNPRDLALNHYQTFGREPFGYAIGPIKDRGDMTGIVVHKGYIVAEWGEPARGFLLSAAMAKSMASFSF